MNAIVIPCHAPKIYRLVHFLCSVKGDVPIIIGATDASEADFFSKQLNNYSHLPLQFFDCAGYAQALGMDVVVNQNNKGVINVKKFLTLRHAMEQGYENMLCIDADSAIHTTTNEAMDAAISNYRHEFFGCPSDEYQFTRITRPAISIFSPEDQQAINNATYGGRLYSWFFDAPLYKKGDLQALFDHMGDGFFQSLRWECFDHLIYQYFLIAQKGAKLHDYTNVGIHNLPEGMTDADFALLKEHYDYTPIWMAQKQVTPESKIHLICHTDRQ